MQTEAPILTVTVAVVDSGEGEGATREGHGFDEQIKAEQVKEAIHGAGAFSE
jgi:hypothetical protein